MRLSALRRVPGKVIISLINVYRIGISPLLGNRCRYYPTCSQYAKDAVHQYGALQGVPIAARRIARCHPLAEGGYDPVPDSTPTET